MSNESDTLLAFAMINAIWYKTTPTYDIKHVAEKKFAFLTHLNLETIKLDVYNLTLEFIFYKFDSQKTPKITTLKYHTKYKTYCEKVFSIMSYAL